MQKKSNNLVIILIILFIIHFLLMFLFGPNYNQETNFKGITMQKAPPRETYIGVIILISLALIIYLSEKTYKYDLE